MTGNNLRSEILEKAQRVKLLLMDCDGVLTDGKLYFSKNGEELKVFNVKDGQGINLWHRAGYLSGIITGRESEMLVRRAGELNINFLKQNEFRVGHIFRCIISGKSLSEINYFPRERLLLFNGLKMEDPKFAEAFLDGF